ncbi:hypothetical protein [Nocardia heshunensis]
MNAVAFTVMTTVTNSDVTSTGELRRSKPLVSSAAPASAATIAATVTNWSPAGLLRVRS